MQESASTLERQSQKAQELLDKIFEVTSLDFVHQRTSQSFSIVDQAEWLKDTAFCCQREYPTHTYIQCDLLDSGTSWVFCLARRQCAVSQKHIVATEDCRIFATQPKSALQTI